MREKIVRLEALVNQAASKIQVLEAENSALKNRMRTVENQNERLRSSDEEARSLRDWKKETISRLKKLHAKIEKEIKGQ